MANISKYLIFLLFADDTNILYANASFKELLRVVNTELEKLSDWFKANRLSLNIKKTNYIMFGFKKVSPVDECIDFQNCVKIDSEFINRVEFTKFLGIIIDDKFTWHRHINSIALKMSKSLGSLCRIKLKLGTRCLRALYYALIYPHLTYCVIIWGSASKTVLNKLFVLQKRALRIIEGCNWRCHTIPLFLKHYLLKLEDIYIVSCILFAYKFKYQMLPQVCNSLMMLNINVNPRYEIRSVNDFLVQTSRTTLREKCISVRGPMYWNAVPLEIKSLSTVSNFKAKLYQYLINKY